MTLGSLFAGIGGLELGLARATGARVVWQVERDPYRRVVLRYHWPEATRYADVRFVRGHWAEERPNDTRARLAATDIICGGFPCTDLSVSATARVRQGRPGLDGAASGLWREYARIVGESAPSWVVIENVYAGWRDWLPIVRGDLWTRGYASVPVALRASDVGLPHRRQRVFVLAYPSEARLERYIQRELEALTNHVEHVARCVGAGPRPARRGELLDRSVLRCSSDGFSRRVDAPALAALGDAVVPPCAEVIGRIIHAVAAARGS